MAEENLRIGVIGTGALGRHHVRILSSLDGADLVGVHDRRPEVAESVAREYGGRVFPSAEDLAGEIEAAVVAVPTVDHGTVAGPLLEGGIHVLVEKPIAPNLLEADTMIRAAESSGAVLAVGHVEFFNPAVQALVGEGPKPRFIEVQRLGRFSPRSLDVDVVLDLMIHDLQILQALDPTPTREVRATGIDVLSPRVDIANVRLELGSGCVANLTASRVSSEKIRKLRLFMPSRYYSLDYQSQEIKGYRLEGEGEPEIVRDDLVVDRQEPLRRELESFVDRCQGRDELTVDGRDGRRALETALAIVEDLSGST